MGVKEIAKLHHIPDMILRELGNTMREFPANHPAITAGLLAVIHMAGNGTKFFNHQIAVFIQNTGELALLLYGLTDDTFSWLQDHNRSPTSGDEFG